MPFAAILSSSNLNEILVPIGLPDITASITTPTTADPQYQQAPHRHGRFTRPAPHHRVTLGAAATTRDASTAVAPTVVLSGETPAEWKSQAQQSSDQRIKTTVRFLIRCHRVFGVQIRAEYFATSKRCHDRSLVLSIFLSCFSAGRNSNKRQRFRRLFPQDKIDPRHFRKRFRVALADSRGIYSDRIIRSQHSCVS